jgi:hypothetical protein
VPSVPWPRFVEEAKEFFVFDVESRTTSVPMSEARLLIWAQCYDLFHRINSKTRVPLISRLLVDGERAASGSNDTSIRNNATIENSFFANAVARLESPLYRSNTDKISRKKSRKRLIGK